MSDTKFDYERLRQMAMDSMMVLGFVVLLAVELPL
jgi:hypothetical protein